MSSFLGTELRWYKINWWQNQGLPPPCPLSRPAGGARPSWRHTRLVAGGCNCGSPSLFSPPCWAPPFWLWSNDSQCMLPPSPWPTPARVCSQASFSRLSLWFGSEPQCQWQRELYSSLWNECYFIYLIGVLRCVQWYFTYSSFTNINLLIFVPLY